MTKELFAIVLIVTLVFVLAVKKYQRSHSAKHFVAIEDVNGGVEKASVASVLKQNLGPIDPSTSMLAESEGARIQADKSRDPETKIGLAGEQEKLLESPRFVVERAGRQGNVGPADFRRALASEENARSMMKNLEDCVASSKPESTPLAKMVCKAGAQELVKKYPALREDFGRLNSR